MPSEDTRPEDRLPFRPRIAVVLVEYRNHDLAEACLASLFGGTYQDFTVYLIDNTPGAVPCDPAQRFPAPMEPNRIRCLAPGRNLGFCGGCNLGIEHALADGCDYVLLLNYDTVAPPDFLEKLAARAQSLPELGILGVKIRYFHDERRLWYAGGRLSLAQGVGKHYGFQTLDEGDYDTFREVSYVTGCCMLVPAAVLRAAGMLKAPLFMYLDDAEFCLRVSRLGYKLYYEPAAVLRHHVGGGVSKTDVPDYYLYFSLRNKPWIAPAWPYRTYLFGYVLALGLAKAAFYAIAPGVRERGRMLRAIAWGVRDAFSPTHKAERRFPALFAASPGQSGGKAS